MSAIHDQLISNLSSGQITSFNSNSVLAYMLGAGGDADGTVITPVAGVSFQLSGGVWSLTTPATTPPPGGGTVTYLNTDSQVSQAIASGDDAVRALLNQTYSSDIMSSTAMGQISTYISNHPSALPQTLIGGSLLAFMTGAGPTGAPTADTAALGYTGQAGSLTLTPQPVATPPPSGGNTTTITTPVISGVQGFDPATGKYTDTVTPGKYLVLYGNFADSGNTVKINNQTVAADYQSATQINVPLPSTLTGTTGRVTVTHSGWTDASTTFNIGTQQRPPVVTAPVISGLQGFDPATGKYTDTITSNKYVVLYGSFAASGNTVKINGQTVTPDYQSATQLNVPLGTLTGSSITITVTNANGTSGSMTINVATPPPVVANPPGVTTVTVVQVTPGVGNQVWGGAIQYLTPDHQFIAIGSGQYYSLVPTTPQQQAAITNTLLPGAITVTTQIQVVPINDTVWGGLDSADKDYVLQSGVSLTDVTLSNWKKDDKGVWQYVGADAAPTLTSTNVTVSGITTTVPRPSWIPAPGTGTWANVTTASGKTTGLLTGDQTLFYEWLNAPAAGINQDEFNYWQSIYNGPAPVVTYVLTYSDGTTTATTITATRTGAHPGIVVNPSGATTNTTATADTTAKAIASTATTDTTTADATTTAVTAVTGGSGTSSGGSGIPVFRTSAGTVNFQGLQMPAGLAYQQPQEVAGAATQETLGNYTVKKGDTLWAIAQKYYGDGGKWRTILEANTDKVNNPRKLKVGTVLVIPKI
jgi:LysM repeat protein